MGAMVFGNPYRERIQMNECTVWAGGPYRNDNPEAIRYLDEIRKDIFDGKYEEAEKLACQKITSQTAHGMPYQTVGNLFLSFAGHENFSDYYRDLNLDNALATTTYKVKDISYKREVFTSFADKIMIIRITADKPSKISFTAALDRPSNVEISTQGNNLLKMTGTTSDHEGIKGQVKFQTNVKIQA